jgi:hypothetical protein
MTIEIIPVKREQSVQIFILEKLAIRFVTFLIPASALAGLVVTWLASSSKQTLR